MDGLVSFGDVIRYKEDLYVYLASTSSITYLAKILQKDISQQLSSLRDKQFTRSDKASKAKSSAIYCFVMLKTEDFSGQAALMAQPGFEPLGDLVYKQGTLCQEDINALKQEILESERMLPGALLEAVKALD